MENEEDPGISVGGIQMIENVAQQHPHSSPHQLALYAILTHFAYTIYISINHCLKIVFNFLSFFQLQMVQNMLPRIQVMKIIQMRITVLILMMNQL